VYGNMRRRGRGGGDESRKGEKEWDGHSHIVRCPCSEKEGAMRESILKARGKPTQKRIFTLT